MFTIFEIPFPENVTVKNYKNYEMDLFQLVKKGNFVHIMNMDFDNYADAAEALADEGAAKELECIKIIVEYKAAGLQGIYRIVKMSDYLRDLEIAMERTLVFDWGHEPKPEPAQQQGGPLFINAIPAAAQVELKAVDIPVQVVTLQSNELPGKDNLDVFHP